MTLEDKYTEQLQSLGVYRQAFEPRRLNMTREQMYKAQMTALGIYHNAFDPAIHTLAIMERENQRAMKALKEARADGADKLAQTLQADIAQQRRDILAYRESLGLTPRALRRLRKDIAAAPAAGRATVLELVRNKAEKTS